MSSYRFCRTDDVPRLVEAHERCYRAQRREVPRMTVEGFRRGARELGLWASSCMLAHAGKEPIGVLLAAKRETESWIHSLGILPGHRRQGHASHMLTSLSQKLAILGPPRLLAEVPEEWSGARALFESCGYRPETTFVDFVRDPSPAEPAELPDAVIPVTLEELTACGALDRESRRSWERSPRTLAQRSEGLRGLALGSGDRFEAWLLYRDPEGKGPREIEAAGCADPRRVEAMLGILVEACCAGADRPVRLRRLCEPEIPFSLLRSRGFRERGRTLGYAARAG